MITGTVKWFNESKRLGFVTPTSGNADEVFHHSAIQHGGIHSLAEDLRVTSNVENSTKDTQTAEVKIDA